jgi:hypothetical protein
MKGKVNLIKAGSVLEGLEVLVDAHVVDGDHEADIKAGQIAYVRADRYVHPWGKDKCTCVDLLCTAEIVGEKEVKTAIEFILVPFSEILVIRDKAE